MRGGFCLRTCCILRIAKELLLRKANMLAELAATLGGTNPYGHELHTRLGSGKGREHVARKLRGELLTKHSSK